jgi:hypothetical protein
MGSPSGVEGDTALMIPEHRLIEVTNGAELPVAPVAAEIMSVLAEKVVEVWTTSVRQYGPAVVDDLEVDLNLRLVARLNAAISEDLMFAQLVHEVTRGSELVDYSGEKPEKRPDLQFSLTRGTPGLPLVGECKIIDRSNDKGMALYCANGISRFLIGQYAWYRREGFMVAYVLDGSIRDEHLLPGMTGRLDRFDVDPGTEYVITKHSRTFKYPHKPAPKDDPGPIDLWHLWLPLSPDE